MKKLTKKIVPNIASKVVNKLKEVPSFYLPYIFGNGRIKTLKSITMEVTMRCNCRCQMCPLYGVQTENGKGILRSIKENKELTIEEYGNLFQDLRELSLESVGFTGGEAFLRKDMIDIARLARKQGLNVSFTSNGGLITEEIAKSVVELGVKHIVISLDGPKKTHEQIRKAKIFDRIMNAVNMIEKEKKKQNKIIPRLSFLCTVSRLNQNKLSELVDISKSKGLPLSIDPIIFTTQDVWDKTMNEFDDAFIKEESFIMPENIGEVDVDVLENELENVFTKAERLSQAVSVSIKGKNTRRKFFTDPNYSVVNKCFAPWYSTRIDPYGNVYPCSLSINMGNIREISMKGILNSDKYVDFRKKLKEKKLFPFCKKCCLLYSPNLLWDYLPKI